jgi:hypothetical protein
MWTGHDTLLTLYAVLGIALIIVLITSPLRAAPVPGAADRHDLRRPGCRPGTADRHRRAEGRRRLAPLLSFEPQTGR